MVIKHIKANIYGEEEDVELQHQKTGEIALARLQRVEFDFSLFCALNQQDQNAKMCERL